MLRHSLETAHRAMRKYTKTIYSGVWNAIKIHDNRFIGIECRIPARIPDIRDIRVRLGVGVFVRLEGVLLHHPLHHLFETHLLFLDRFL